MAPQAESSLVQAAARTFDALIHAIASALEAFARMNAQALSQSQVIDAKHEKALAA
jgi:hypothetical protein